MPTTISITAIASISGLGNDQDVIWQNYLNDNHCFVQTTVGNQNTAIAPLNSESKKKISELKKSESKTIILATFSMAAEALDIKSLTSLLLASPKSDIVVIDTDDENIIEIDPRQTPSEYLDTAIHEKLHLIFPNSVLIVTK